MEGRAIVLLLIAVTALSFADDYVEILYRAGAPLESGWKVGKRADPNHKTEFLISLQQRNLAELERRFWANSDPTSGVFAQHMTKLEIDELTAPSRDTVKSVMKWIRKVGKELPHGHLIDVEHQVDAIRVVSTNLFAETLFKTKMHIFINDRTNLVVTKQLGGVSIPADLLDHVTLVTGITELPPVKSTAWKQNQPKIKVERQSFNADNLCNNPFTIKNLYDIPQNLMINQPRSNASIYAEPSAGAQDGFGLASIEDYQHALGLPKNPITCILGNGAQYYIVNDTDIEANLDTEMMAGMAPNVDVCFYLMESGNGWMYEFSREVMSTKGAPLIVSMSYGWNEVDSCNNVTSDYDFLGNCSGYHIPNSRQYVNLTNINFQKLGLIGHTMIAASGDAGTAGTHGSLNGCETMGPIFPAASPYVLTVGATSIEISMGDEDRMDASNLPAICTDSFYACNCSTSRNEQPALANNTAEFDTGGGFSMYSPQHQHQVQAVQAYLKSGVLLPPAEYFNGNNRGFPDVAGVGENFCLLNPGTECEPVGGTSASTPLWGSIMVMLNNDRIAAGKNPLGYINQVIYNMFYADSNLYFNNDFEYGNNPGGCPSNMGFNAIAGHWTPLTGCGSPNFNQIRRYVANLP